MKKIIALSVFAALSLGAQANEGDAAQDRTHFVQHLDKNYANIKKQVCNQLDLKINVTAGPFFYTDPNASCDLGFQMPGLPDFNLGFEGLDSCKLLKSVTGELVDKINQEMQDAVNGGLEGVGLEDGDFDIDFGDIVIDEVGGG